MFEIIFPLGVLGLTLYTYVKTKWRPFLLLSLLGVVVVGAGVYFGEDSAFFDIPYKIYLLLSFYFASKLYKDRIFKVGTYLFTISLFVELYRHLLQPIIFQPLSIGEFTSTTILLVITGLIFAAFIFESLHAFKVPNTIAAIVAIGVFLIPAYFISDSIVKVYLPSGKKPEIRTCGDITTSSMWPWVNEVQRDMWMYKTDSKDLSGLSTEGGIQIDYYDEEGSLRLSQQRLYGETGKRESEFYFNNGKVFYINSNTFTYEKPIYVESDPTITSTTSSLP